MGTDILALAMEPCPTPTVHRNGTSREGLMEARMAVVHAADALAKALAAATPNERDYYTQEQGAGARARAEALVSETDYPGDSARRYCGLWS